MGTGSLREITEKLESLFSTFNEHFFSGELQRPVITVSPNRTRRARYMGWCTLWKAWEQHDGSEGYYEINICAEYLTEPFAETCNTLIHEMVHLLNVQRGIQDCSRGGLYHNKKFQDTAERCGLIVEKDKRYGWCITKLSEETSTWLRTAFPNEEGFRIFRNHGIINDPADEECEDDGSPVAAAKSSTKRYICPGCGTIIRATKEVRVTCTDCKLPFERATLSG